MTEQEVLRTVNTVLANGKLSHDNGQQIDEIFNYSFWFTVKDALEKRIPQRPCLEADGYSDGQLVYDTYDCPNCDTEYEIEYEGKIKYCNECGQAFDWTE